MEIIRLSHPYEEESIVQDDIVLILGFFDGVHRAHQKMIQHGVQVARDRGLKAAVMTFDRHPGFVFSKFHPDTVKYLTTLTQKEEKMAELGVDILYEVDFTSKFGALSPREFVDQYIIGLNTAVVVAGFDYTFGKKEHASMPHLKELSENQFEVITMPKMEDSEGAKISSTTIRQAIRDGDVEKANDLLGWPFETRGFVIHGKARGRKIGYPTANIYPSPELLVPKEGVYITRINVEGQWHNSMTSIGYNVTFGYQQDPTIECNIFDFNEKIYGENVRIQWLKYLRSEEKYDTLDALIERLDEDEIESRRYFGER